MRAVARVLKTRTWLDRCFAIWASCCAARPVRYGTSVLLECKCTHCTQSVFAMSPLGYLLFPRPCNSLQERNAPGLKEPVAGCRHGYQLPRASSPRSNSIICVKTTTQRSALQRGWPCCKAKAPLITALGPSVPPSLSPGAALNDAGTEVCLAKLYLNLSAPRPSSQGSGPVETRPTSLNECSADGCCCMGCVDKDRIVLHCGLR
jgi:hypothetical protein